MEEAGRPAALAKWMPTRCVSSSAVRTSCRPRREGRDGRRDAGRARIRGGDLDEALRSGRVEIEGDRSAVERLLGLFPLPKPAPRPEGPL